MPRVIRGERCISRSEAAKIADVPLREVDRWIRNGAPNVVNLKLRIIRIGTLRRIYIKEKIFEKFLSDKRACDAVRDMFIRAISGQMLQGESPPTERVGRRGALCRRYPVRTPRY